MLSQLLPKPQRAGVGRRTYQERGGPVTIIHADPEPVALTAGDGRPRTTSNRPQYRRRAHSPGVTRLCCVVVNRGHGTLVRSRLRHSLFVEDLVLPRMSYNEKCAINVLTPAPSHSASAIANRISRTLAPRGSGAHHRPSWISTSASLLQPTRNSTEMPRNSATLWATDEEITSARPHLSLGSG